MFQHSPEFVSAVDVARHLINRFRFSEQSNWAEKVQAARLAMARIDA